MKKNIVLLCAVLLCTVGCDSAMEYFDKEVTPQPSQVIVSPDTAPTEVTGASPTPQAKITSNFENAPNIQSISDETGKNISAVLLQDTLTYTIPLKDYFAICLEEDTKGSYRWLLASEDSIFRFTQEAHINGYRVYIFEPLSLGEETILFELTQDNTILVETLSYQLVFTN